jgi:hypothetical protein
VVAGGHGKFSLNIVALGAGDYQVTLRGANWPRLEMEQLKTPSLISVRVSPMHVLPSLEMAHG